MFISVFNFFAISFLYISSGDDPEQMWHSSSIVQRISNRKVSTAGGSIYILLGPMDKREAQEQSETFYLLQHRFLHHSLKYVNLFRRNHICVLNLCNLNPLNFFTKR